MATREPVIDTGPRRAVGSLPSANGPVFAWRTDEWHLSPETLAVSKANAQGGLNGGGSTRGVHAATGRGHGVVEGETLCVPLVAVHEHGKKQTLSPKQPSANTSPTQSEGYGASPLGRRRKGSVPRTCSANGCCTDVLDRAQGLVVMCPAHRRVTSGVAVDCDGGDGELMRWCYHCKKAHSLAAFADSVIGLSRKLATCERGRAARRAAFAKKAADQQTASVEDDARTGDTAATVFNHDEFFALGGAADHGQPPPAKANGAFTFGAKQHGYGTGPNNSPLDGPKSKAQTLASVATARARGRRGDTRGVKTSSRNGSVENTQISFGSGSHGSGEYDDVDGDELLHHRQHHRADGGYDPMASFTGPRTTNPDRDRDASNPRHHPSATHHDRTVHQPSVADWHQKTFDDVVFEVSTKATPELLLMGQHDLFAEMGAVVQRGVFGGGGSGYKNDTNRSNQDDFATEELRGTVNNFFSVHNPFVSRTKFVQTDAAESGGSGPDTGHDAQNGDGFQNTQNAQNQNEVMSRGIDWIDSLSASMLPGSTRVVVTATAGSAAGGAGSRSANNPNPHPSATDFALGLPTSGALGQRDAVITAHPCLPVGFGWKRFASREGRSRGGSGRRDGSDSTSVTVDTVTGAVTPSRTFPFPKYVKVPPVATLGEPLAISNLKGGERVHVFGQKSVPFSYVVPLGVTTIHVTPPPLSTGTSVTAFTPGFLFVQVLAPGQPATGSAFVKVLLMDDPDVVYELDALRRGAAFDFGVGEDDDVVGNENTRVNSRSNSRTQPTQRFKLNPVPGFTDENAFERFVGSFGVLVQSHWQSLLYSPTARDAAFTTIANFARIASFETCPAIHALFSDIAEDVDSQWRHETGGGDARNVPSWFAREDADASAVCDGYRVSTGGEWGTGPVTDRGVLNTGARFSGLVNAAVSFRRFVTAATESAFTIGINYHQFTFLVATFNPRSDMSKALFSDDHALPMTRQTRVAGYARCFNALALFIIIGTFRATHWQMAPLEFANAYVPFAPVILVFFAANRDPVVRTWLHNRSWMLGSGGVFLDDAETGVVCDTGAASVRDGRTTRQHARRNSVSAAAATTNDMANDTTNDAAAKLTCLSSRNVRHAFIFDVLVVVVLMACNGTIGTISTERLAGRASQKWITGFICAVGNPCFFAVFSAEHAPPSKARFDIFVTCAAAAGLFFVPPSRWGEFFSTGGFPFAQIAKPYTSALRAAVACFLTPIVVASAVRRAYRVHLRMGAALGTKTV